MNRLFFTFAVMTLLALGVSRAQKIDERLLSLLPRTGLRALTGAAGIDVVAADESRAATPATMIGLDAPVYNVLGQRVSPKTKGLVIYKGRKYVNR